MATATKQSLPRQSLRAAFNESGECYRAAFPQKLANLVISSAGRIVYVSPEAAAHLTENVAEVKAMVRARSRLMRDRGFAAAAGRHSINDARLEYLSFTGKAADIISVVPDAQPAKMNLLFNFDHEIAHMLAKFTPHVAESAADAFAMLRHLQRFGNETGLCEYAPVSISSTIFSSPIHYTSAVMQKVASLRKEGSIDIQALSLRETLKLANKIAVEYALDDATLDAIHRAYLPVAEMAAQKQPWEEIIKAVMVVMLNNKNNPDIYRAGRLFLKRPNIKPVLASALETDAFIEKALTQMLRHEKKSGFMLNAADAKDAVKRKPLPTPRLTAGKQPHNA